MRPISESEHKCAGPTEPDPIKKLTGTWLEDEQPSRISHLVKLTVSIDNHWHII